MTATSSSNTESCEWIETDILPKQQGKKKVAKIVLLAPPK